MRERDADYLLMRRLAVKDCRRCCQPANHHGDCCSECLERAKPEPYRRRS